MRKKYCGCCQLTVDLWHCLSCFSADWARWLSIRHREEDYCCRLSSSWSSKLSRNRWLMLRKAKKIHVNWPTYIMRFCRRSMSCHAHRLLLERWKIFTSIGKPSRQHHEMEYEFSSVGKAPSDINTFPLSSAEGSVFREIPLMQRANFISSFFRYRVKWVKIWVEEKIMKNSRFKLRSENQILSHEIQFSWV